jgi:hypothetical protein
MSSVISSCPTCGRTLDAGVNCPQCQISSYAAYPATSAAEPLRGAYTDLLWAFAVWGVSGGFLIVLDFAYRFYIWRTQGAMPDIQFTPLLAIVTLAFTMVMQLAGLGAAWLAVTRIGKRPFWQTLGWNWHPRFRLIHAFGLALVMLGVAVAAEKLLPHRQTDMEKLLKLGLAVKLMLAALAVLTAPLVEEIVYRGVIFSGVEGLWGTRAAIVLATAVFAIVHVPQYWGSWAANTAILSLSLVLTLLRAWSGQLLPCVVVHLVYNGIQAGLVLAASDKTAQQNQTETAFVSLMRWLGWC